VDEPNSKERTEASDSEGPDFAAYLNCGYDKRLARFFLWNQIPSLALMLLGPALVGYITGAWWPLIGIAIGAVVLWGFGLETRLLCSHYIIRHDFCSRCVNFSCPLNSVPKHIVDAYLEQNPVMREAWVKSGYQLGES
jgi:hypothetical protein